MPEPDPRRLKHRPVALLRYDDHDGMYAGNTDCLYLSLGWAQWDPRTLSVKTMRAVSEQTKPKRWSRLSEELPLHRALDAVLLIASTIAEGKGAQSVTLNAGVLENQKQPKQLLIEVENETARRIFEDELHSELVLRRLRSLAKTLRKLNLGEESP